MNDVSVYDFKTPFYQALLEPNVMMGVGLVPVMAILVLTVFMMNLISPFMIVFGIILFVIAKIVCKKDPYNLEILFERLLDFEVWRKN